MKYFVLLASLILATIATASTRQIDADQIRSSDHSKTWTPPAATDTLVGRVSTDTLTNKTLTTPVISSISNTGTLTLPTSTDTLVGRATVDTLTNKTLTSPTLSSPSLTNPLVSGMTAGYLYFAGAGGSITQDYSSLFWDKTNHRLGLGDTSPAYRLHVQAEPGVDQVLRLEGDGASSHRFYDFAIDSSGFFALSQSGAGFYALSIGNGGDTVGVGVYGGLSGATLAAVAADVDNIPLVARGFGGGVANLQEWRKSDNTVEASISQDGTANFNHVIDTSLTADTVPYNRASDKRLTSSATTSTELGYVHGVTSAIQTQLSNSQPLNSNLTAVAGLASNGLVAKTGAGTVATRTLTAPAAGITVSNGDGVSGNPTLALANDLAALEAISGTNVIPYRSAADTWGTVTIGTGLSFSAGTLSTSSSSSANFTFGGGTDGNLTSSSGTTTLTRDTYYNNVTLSGTGKINTAGYRLFIAGTLDLTAAGTGAIQYNGNNGTDGNSTPSGTAGAAGGAVTANTVGGGIAGTGGGAGAAVSAGANGTAALTCSTAEGSVGGGGGTAGNGGNGGSTGGTGGNNTSPTNGMAFARYATDLIYAVTLYGGGCGGGSGGGGGGDGSNAGGGGGGSGSGAGVMYIAANTLKRTGAAAGSIEALGGNGGNGGGHSTNNTGGGAGGGGGGGGWIYFIYNTLGDATPATNLFDVSGGSGGAGGNGGTPFSGHSGGDGGGGGGGGRITLINTTTITSSSDTFGGSATTKNSSSTSTGAASKAGQVTQVTL